MVGAGLDHERLGNGKAGVIVKDLCLPGKGTPCRSGNGCLTMRKHAFSTITSGGAVSHRSGKDVYANAGSIGAVSHPKDARD